MTKGQLSVEFFLVVAFTLGLASALLAVTEGQIQQTTILDHAALARSALNAVTHSANHVWLSGNGTRVVTEVFVPPNSVCLIYNATQKRFYCDVGARCPSNSSQTCYPYGEQLIPNTVTLNNTTCPPYNPLAGWYRMQLEHNGSAVVAQCTRLT